MRKLLIIAATLAWAAGGAAGNETVTRGTTEAALMKEGAVRLTAAEVRSLIVGSTEAAKYERAKWPVTYYTPDGVMDIRLPGGRRTSEPYRLRGDGGVCYGTSFGTCHYFLRLRGELIAVRRGRVLAVAKIVRGRHL